MIVEGLTLFFNSHKIIGSELRLSNQSWKNEFDYVQDFTTKNKAFLLVRIKNEINDEVVLQQDI